ncbi:MAG: hypothetical protein QN178_03300 [Armatimonadota bacterium]|nr:hypothetical protein [Armatimonadota bacterium]
MKAMLVAGGITLALLATSGVPAFAAGPRWGAGPGPAVQAPSGVPRGPAAQAPARAQPVRPVGVAATIPADVHKAIQTAVHAAAARTLKITPEALDKEIAAGKTMAAIAAARNVPLATVRTAMLNARKYAVNQALAAGKITKAQADALLQAGPRWNVTDGPGARPMMGPRQGMGPGAGARQGAGPRRGHMRYGMHRYGPGR